MSYRNLLESIDKSICKSTVNFLGRYNNIDSLLKSDKEYSYGDIVSIYNDKTKEYEIYTYMSGNTWEQLSSYESLSDNTPPVVTEHKCPNCGAPLNIVAKSRSIKCEYCDSVFSVV